MKVIVTVLSAMLLFSLSACGNSSGGSSGGSASQNQSQTKNKIPDKNSASNNSTNKSNNSSQDASNDGSTGTSNNSNSANDNSQSTLDKRTNAVINATLKYESKQPNTTVDYTSKTMTQNGKKVGFSIIPTSDHQNDFKEGFIKEVINNKDESHDVTLFQYKIDDNNNLSLIDTSTEKVVYTTSF